MSPFTVSFGLVGCNSGSVVKTHPLQALQPLQPLPLGAGPQTLGCFLFLSLSLNFDWKLPCPVLLLEQES